MEEAMVASRINLRLIRPLASSVAQMVVLEVADMAHLQANPASLLSVAPARQAKVTTVVMLVVVPRVEAVVVLVDY